MADKDSVKNAKFAIDEESPGARLRQARESQEKTLQQASDELRLDRWMIEAIERDDFTALGAPVFAKGHLRQYAKLLGIDADDLMVGYYQVCGSREQPPLLAESVLRTESHSDKNFSWVLPTLLAVVVISAIGVGIYLWMQPTQEPSSIASEPNQLTLGADSTAAVIPALVPEQEDVAEPEIDNNSGTIDDSGADDLLIPAISAPEVDESVDEALGAGSIVSNNLTVTLRFSESSWVEVYDSKRQKLLFGLVESASVKYLSGPPPLNVFLGRQNAVKVEVNGAPYTIPGDALRGNTARFIIEKSQ